jgi:putative serine protease PepD
MDTNPKSTHDTHAPSTANKPLLQRLRRMSVAGLLTLALATGGLGGSAVGATLTAHWLATPSAQASVVSAQPIAQVAQTNINVAGMVLDEVGPSVVEITTTGQINTRRFQYSQSGTGSGFVIDADGLIVTNRHVVAGASAITVQFSTGEERTARVVGSDSTNDIALLQVESMPSDIPAVTLGDSDAIAVGETAIAIGSPFGLEQTVTQGIISAINRDWAGSSSALSGLIQTDAPINPGNSGGPLLNGDGEVIGINTLIESPVEGNVGIGFAVPINMVKQQLAQLEAGATLEQGYLGVTIVEPTEANQAGVTIGEVAVGSGAAQAGLQAGDSITGIDDQSITDYASLAAQISGKQPGDTVTVTFERGGQEQQVDVTLGARTS